MLEKDMWTKVRKGFGGLWRCRRIEDKLSLGVPDVFFSLPHGAGRIAGMMELKCQDTNKTGNIVARHYTQEQRDFATLHETVFLLLYCDGWFMLFDHTMANDILSGQTFGWHTEVSLFASKTPEWANIAHAIKKSLLKAA